MCTYLWTGTAVIYFFTKKKASKAAVVWSHRRKEDKEIHIISSAEEWEEWFPVLSLKCSLIKVMFLRLKTPVNKYSMVYTIFPRIQFRSCVGL